MVIFGAAFGLAATQTGLDNSSIMLMSSFVFAGASQFATLELWGAQISLIPLIVTVFFINARHLLMGASLYPWLRHLSFPSNDTVSCWLFLMPIGHSHYKHLIVVNQGWAYCLEGALRFGSRGF